MKKTILLLFVLILLKTNISQAQFSGGVNLGLLNWSDAKVNYFGLNFSGKYAVNEKINVGLNLGYYGASEDEGGDEYKYKVIPITASFDYSFSENKFSPYAGLDLGFYVLKFDFEFEDLDLFTGEPEIVTESESSSELGFAPTFGANYGLTESLSLNANFKYHYLLTEGKATSLIGLGAGVMLKF